MFFPSSGHHCFDLITLSPEKRQTLELPSKAVLLQMLKRECELRLSPGIQQLFTKYTNDENYVTFITDRLQQHVVEEFGYKDVDILRAAQSLYPGDNDISESAFYIKYNRCRQGSMTEGNTVPDVKLLSLDGTVSSINTYFQESCKAGSLNPSVSPLVLVAGSIS